MSRFHRAAVGDGVQKCLSPIERHVKADCKPKISRAPKSEAEEKADQTGSQCSQPRFTLVAQMQRTERSGEKGGCRPESNAARQSKLRVTPKQVLFKETDQKKYDTPEHGEFDDANPMQREMPEVEAMQAAQRSQ